MFLTISMLWQWQNKQLLFFSRQFLNPQATFLKWHPNIVTADFVLLFRCRFGMSYWQPKSIHGDRVMRTRISEQPDTDHHLRAGDDESSQANFCSDTARFVREYFSFQNKWLLADFGESVLFCKIFFSRCPKLLVHRGSEIHSCDVGSAQDLQISLLLLGAADPLHREVCISSTLCIFCEHVTTKHKKLLWSIITHKPPGSWSPVAKHPYI